jgi:hypothetical protein
MLDEEENKAFTWYRKSVMILYACLYKCQKNVGVDRQGYLWGVYR